MEQKRCENQLAAMLVGFCRFLSPISCLYEMFYVFPRPHHALQAAQTTSRLSEQMVTSPMCLASYIMLFSKCFSERCRFGSCDVLDVLDVT